MLSNKTLKLLLSLKNKKYRAREQKFLIEGARLCEEAIASDHRVEYLLHLPPKLLSARAAALLEKCQQTNTGLEQINSDTFNKLADTVNSQGIIGVVQAKKISVSDVLAADPKTLVALQNVRDPGNLGTICRTASWFGVHALLLGQGCVEFTNPKVIRATMGAAFHLPVVENIGIVDLLEMPSLRTYRPILADVSARMKYTDLPPAEKNLLILSGETELVSEILKQRVQTHVRIPGSSKLDSLNVSAAAAILLAELNRNKT